MNRDLVEMSLSLRYIVWQSWLLYEANIVNVFDFEKFYFTKIYIWNILDVV